MSTVDADLEVAETAAANPGRELTQARQARVGDMTVRRLLPLRLRRSVGAWCFVDHYGPMSVDGVTGMRVPPHPHLGLQTVTWLISGNVLHRDSLGSEQMIRPGQLNLMTAGRGIAHSEESPAEHDPSLHGVQLWVALPDASRHTEPAFSHHAELPTVGLGGFEVTVFAGALAGQRSPARMFSEIVGAELAAARAAAGRVPLAAAHEHVIFTASGPAEADGTVLRPGQLLYLGPGRDRVEMSAPEGGRVFLLGGAPLGERLLMWWNLVARTPAEIEAARSDWQAGRFGPVSDYDGEPLTAPPLDPRLLIRRP
ncbi:MAG TPA: pirin family protein [Streptosporangiaceae bacterium]|nr:pirin family protein [Streptosporangiaceae bacterium]